MHSQRTFTYFCASILCIAGIANAAYSIQDTYDASNFFNEFTFFNASDPTHGAVDYLTGASANSKSLAGFSNGAVYLGVDSTTVNPTGGRASTRVTGNKSYNASSGLLVIGDIEHMPEGCGTWPAFWMVGPNWPNEGEIDILEGVNEASSNAVTLHTSSGCTVSGAGIQSSSVLQSTDCNSGNGNTGCSTSTNDTQSIGTGFNDNNGGVYAMEWTSAAIAVHFFTRSAIPADITSGTPDPSTWGTPMASFTAGSTCDFSTHFTNQQIIFDTTFCGDWAGASAVWGASTCSSLASTCDAYVAANPSAFERAYWTINSVKVYSQSSGTKRATPFVA
jgi:hypothetical protein